jgi:hypothetical protein
MDFNIAAND